MASWSYLQMYKKLYTTRPHGYSFLYTFMTIKNEEEKLTFCAFLAWSFAFAFSFAALHDKKNQQES